MKILTPTALAVAALLAASVASAQPGPAPQAPTTIQHAEPTVVDGVRHLVVSNAPVADTPENRAKYGKPLSRAGRRTKPNSD